LTTLKDTATPVIIDNDAGIRQTTNVKNSKPCILGYINDKLNEMTSLLYHCLIGQYYILLPY
jgi:hypothetical protein